MDGMGGRIEDIEKRIRACDYLTVAQLFLRDNFLLESPLTFSDIKPRLLGHFGTCHGINVIYAGLKSAFFGDENFSVIIGPGHGFPALQANLFVDGDLEKVDKRATRDLGGIRYICRNFSWPGGYPSHASPFTPGVVTEGGELGYALGAAYGVALGHPEKTVAVLIGDGEMETATTMASLNLLKLVGGEGNGLVLPILHLNGYKISGPTVMGRKSRQELYSLIRGFGFTPIEISENNLGGMLKAFRVKSHYDYGERGFLDHPFYILRSEKGETGPVSVNGWKVRGNYLSHQIPLLEAGENVEQLEMLENWLKSYRFSEVYDKQKGFLI